MHHHQQLMMMSIHSHYHHSFVEVPKFQLHHSSRALLWDSGSNNSMPSCRLSVLPLLSTDSPILGQLFEATFSCHSVLAGPNLPDSAPCLVLSYQQTFFLSKAQEERLQSCTHHSWQSDALLISYRLHSEKPANTN